MGMSDAQKSMLVQAAQLIADAIKADVAAIPEIAVSAPASEPIIAAPTGHRPIAWGAKVSETFRDRVWWICDQLDIDPDWLMACMHWESGGTFSASVTNAAGSGATGLIQFMPSTARSLGTTVQALAAMTAEDQLNWVYKYFRPWAGKLHGLADTYMTILWPAAVGKPDNYAIFTSGIAYKQNAGLDINHDGTVTKIECASKVLERLTAGKRPENMA